MYKILVSSIYIDKDLIWICYIKQLSREHAETIGMQLLFIFHMIPSSRRITLFRLTFELWNTLCGLRRLLLICIILICHIIELQELLL